MIRIVHPRSANSDKPVAPRPCSNTAQAPTSTAQPLPSCSDALLKLEVSSGKVSMTRWHKDHRLAKISADITTILALLPIAIATSHTVHPWSPACGSLSNP